MISNINSIEQNAEIILSNNSRSKVETVKGKDSFESILKNTFDEVKFSKHASRRLNERSLDLTPEQAHRLSEGVEKAGAKGIQDSLVLMDSMAFIVNVPSNTVVTALDPNESMEKIFTNIDGAVII